jgi:hypothetical protein
MGSAAVGVGTRSLGDLISALRPGDSCPWCGGRLESGTTLRQVGVSGAQEVPLLCSECGCEISAATAPVGAHGRRPLWAAA